MQSPTANLLINHRRVLLCRERSSPTANAIEIQIPSKKCVESHDGRNSIEEPEMLGESIIGTGVQACAAIPGTRGEVLELATPPEAKSSLVKHLPLISYGD